MSRIESLSPDIACNVTEDGIAHITLSRLPVNALTVELLKSLAGLIARLDAIDDCRVVVLDSGISGVFSAGLDLRELGSDLGKQVDLFAGLIKTDIIGSMRHSSKVFIAHLSGHALGGGLELALGCDFRVGTSGDWKLQLPEAQLGGMPGGGGLQFVSRIAGNSRALYMGLTGKEISPLQAYEWGILDVLADPPSDEVMAFANSFAGISADTVHAVKTAVLEGRETSLEEAFALERELYDSLVSRGQLQEGLQRFYNR